MISVVIVDDEYLLRQLIKNSINWQSLGMEIVGEVEDGEQAIKIIGELKPQIVIMDINIPFINGIEVSKIIRGVYPDIKIIILTGYGEFKYAKEAINIGVINYILKPIDAKEFEKILINVKKDIKERDEQTCYIKNSEFKSFLENKEIFLNTLLAKNNNPNIKEELKYYNINLEFDDIIVVVMSVDNLKEKFQNQNEIDIRKFIVQNISEQIILENLQSVVFNGENDYVIAIVNNSVHSEEISRYMFNDVWNKINSFMKNHCDFTVTIAVSKCHSGYTLIPLSYQEAVTAINKRFIYGNQRIIYFEDSWNNTSKTDFHIFYDKNQMLIDLRIENFEKIKVGISQIYETLFIDQASKEFVIFVSIDLISLVTEYITESNSEIQSFIKNEENFIELLKSKETIHDIRNLIFKFYDDCINFISINKKSSTQRSVKKAEAYIEDNYFNANLSLEEIALNIFINPSYLSKVFKMELGCSVIEFVTEFRMKKVKEILDSGKELQLWEIAEQTGYNDPYYLSKCFKKYFGLTPSKYFLKQKK